MLATFLLTVIFDLTVAVEVGLVLASLLFIMRISSLTRLERIRLPADLASLPGGTTVGAWRVFGSLFFGSVGKIEALLNPAEPLPDIMVLEMHQVLNLDSTGLDALKELNRHLERRGGRLILAELNEQPLTLLTRSGYLQELGADKVFERVEDAYERIRARHPGSPPDGLPLTRSSGSRGSRLARQGPPWVFQSSIRVIRVIRLVAWSKWALKNIVFCASPS